MVIENGELMERWWDVVPLLPEAWRINTLIAYRGHRSDLRSLIKWIKTHQEDIELGFYGDFDPYGVRIGLRSYAQLCAARGARVLHPDRSTEPRGDSRQGQQARHLQEPRRLFAIPRKARRGRFRGSPTR